jgi:hypothetical protein
MMATQRSGFGSVHPWKPTTKPIDLKHLGKLIEELGELQAALARCIIQGINEKEPTTGKLNRDWLEEEIADTLANIELVISHFTLNRHFIEGRSDVKMRRLKVWHDMLDE